MNFISLVLVAVALSLDAFGVALCIGLNNRVKRGNKLGYAFSFGFFQFFFSILGAFAGFLFIRYVANVPNIVGGLVIAAVGILMIKEGIENKGECPLLKPKMYFILGVSVSIDAMVIGFTMLNNLGSNLVLLRDTLFIGLVTFVISVFAFILSRYLKRIEVLGRYADYLGGIILVLFGIKMIFF